LSNNLPLDRYVTLRYCFYWVNKYSRKLEGGIVLFDNSASILFLHLIHIEYFNMDSLEDLSKAWNLEAYLEAFKGMHC